MMMTAAIPSGASQFELSFFNSKTDNKAKTGMKSWESFCSLFKTPCVRESKDGPLFSPAIFDPSVRSNNNVKSLSMVVFDIDHGADIEEIRQKLDSLNCSYLVSSTHSHCRAVENNPNAEPRYRVVIPLHEPVSPEPYTRIWRGIRAGIALAVDESAKDVGRMYYLPAIATKDASYYLHISDGEFLDWKALAREDVPPVEKSRLVAAPVLDAVINSGCRNVTMTSLAGGMQRRGMSKPAILAALLAENAAKCIPPLPDFEVQKIAKSVSQYPSEPNTDSPDALQPISIGSLVADYPRLRSPVIEGLLRSGEVANLIAKSKVGKSWMIYYIALCVACKIKLFGEYQCYSGRVLLVDNELHPETLAQRLREVAEALGLRPEEYSDRIDIITLRGKLRNIDQMLLTFDSLKDRGYKLIIIDALYRMLPAGVAENSNEGLAQVYNRIDQYAAMTGAAILLVHHATKGGQGEKDVTDVGAGAGAQSRAADTHIVLRPHKEEGCAVLEAVVRSWKPVEPLPLRWEFPLWRRAADLDANALKGRKSQHEERQQEKDAKGMDDIFNALWKEPDTVKGLTCRVGMGPARIERLIGALVQGARIESTEVPAARPRL